MSKPDPVVQMHRDQLRRAGKDILVPAAAEFLSANRAFDRTDDGLDQAFLRPTGLGGTWYGPVHGAWTSLRDLMQTILANTESNLELTGRALCLAAEMNRITDGMAGAALDRLRSELDRLLPARLPPPELPDQDGRRY